MIKKQKEIENDQDKQEELINLFQLMDLDTQRRRQLIMDQIKERLQQKQSEGSKLGSSYSSIVKEEEVNIQMNILGIIAEKLFMRGRKLRPIVKVAPPKSVEGFSECKIVVHVIKAENVPIRHEIFDQYEMMINQDKDGYSRNRNLHRPTANMP